MYKVKISEMTQYISQIEGKMMVVGGDLDKMSGHIQEKQEEVDMWMGKYR